MQIVFLFPFFISATRGKGIDRVPLPPPQYGAGADSFRKGIDRVPLPSPRYGAGADSFRNPEPAQSSSTRPSAPSSERHDGTAFPGSSASDNHVLHVFIPICY
jgi:E3 ubiquitin-protein ligase RGLG